MSNSLLLRHLNVLSKRPILLLSKSQIRFVNYEKSSVLDLKERNLISNVFPDRRDKVCELFTKPQTFYCGFDPTAESLHVGNLLGLIFLMHCQRRGHTPIVLIGSATALIGDPSDKLKEREAIHPEIVIKNSKQITDCIQRIFKNHEEDIWNHGKQYLGAKAKKEALNLPKLKVLNNLVWHKSLNYAQFLASYGRKVRMSDLLSRKQIDTRLKSKEGLSYTEFSYQILQAYDWFHLLENHDCRFQVGGHDQIGNITTGYELIDKFKPNAQVYGITFPLLTTTKGEKLGKTAGNAIWLDEQKLSNYDFYQYFYNTSDQMVETYLKTFTFLSINEIEDLLIKHKRNPKEYIAQKKLAEQMTILVRGMSGFESAIKCLGAAFFSDVESLGSMTENELDSVFSGIPILNLQFRKGMTLLELATYTKKFTSIEEAARKISEGSVVINYAKQNDPQIELVKGVHILKNNFTLIRIGKQSVYAIKWTE